MAEANEICRKGLIYVYANVDAVTIDTRKLVCIVKVYRSPYSTEDSSGYSMTSCLTQVCQPRRGTSIAQ